MKSIVCKIYTKDRPDKKWKFSWCISIVENSGESACWNMGLADDFESLVKQCEKEMALAQKYIDAQ